ncbi:MFS transporter [Herbiconiux flava]|uniref:CP family cyanate transporter-like MFS transporter n=1 Tax=Herbiconiux flava TaxID=881268 RepID=A0A852SSE9_9MICO|nr:MFS transporter [Herbiconiux flava]NYD71624.1 CP family cyanate transporter-like MFS transporter [Herbiconiux flava]GLK18412.1 putative MFS transporter [Herbiconiux flava]
MTPADRGGTGVRPLWQGRTVALLAVVLVGLNLRTAVAALSPIYDRIGEDFAIGAIGIGFLGTLPPVSFAVVGLFAPALHRRFGVERVMVVAIVAILLGHLVRASSGSYLVLVLASAVTFAGMGVANVLLPPLVKTYFPDRIGLLTALYATIMAMGATLPPLVAVPVADASSWRVSVGMWAVFAVLALVPLVTLLARRMRDRRDAADGAAPADAEGLPGPVDVPIERRKGFGRVLRSPVAWSLMLVFALTSVNAYAMFAWLPSILTDVAGASEAEAGALLSLFSVMGLPAALLVPILATRMRTVGPLIAAGVVFYIVGYGGLLLAPGGPLWLWVAFIGLGPLLFPLSLVLINLRTRTHEGSVALSSFVQSIGYGIGALGPLVVGVLHDSTGGWTVPLLFLVGTALALTVSGIVVARPRMLEDEW